MKDIIKKLDADGDGIIGEWELKAAMDGPLSIPSFQQSMIIDLLLDNSENRVSVSTFMDTLQQLYFDIKEFKQSEVSPTLRSIAKENELRTTLTFVSLFSILRVSLAQYSNHSSHGSHVIEKPRRGRYSTTWTRIRAATSRSQNSKV